MRIWMKNEFTESNELIELNEETLISWLVTSGESSPLICIQAMPERS